MQQRTIPCLVAAGFLGVALCASATQALAGPPAENVVVQGKRIDPATQRVVSYADLNLTIRQDRRRLDHRIYRTAGSLCFQMNGFDSGECTSLAVRSTDAQVAEAVKRAYRKMAGLPTGPALQITMVIGH